MITQFPFIMQQATSKLSANLSLRAKTKPGPSSTAAVSRNTSHNPSTLGDDSDRDRDGEVEEKSDDAVEGKIDDEAAKTDGQLARLSVISYNIINILTPPKDLSFGRYNKRPINDNMVKALEKRFQTSEFDPRNPNSMIPIMLDRSQLDSNCINNDATLGVAAKWLQLAEGTTLKMITALGGNHRQTAIQNIVDRLTSEDKKLKDRIENLGRKSQTPSVKEEIKGYEVKKEKLNEDIAKFSTWGAVVFDESMEQWNSLYISILTSGIHRAGRTI